MRKPILERLLATRWIWLTIAAAALTLLYFCFLPSTIGRKRQENPENYQRVQMSMIEAKPGVNSENYGRIRIGMTRQQVMEILGRAPDYGPGMRKSDDHGFTITSRITHDHGEAWENGTVTIYVVFRSLDGYVTGKSLEVASPDRASRQPSN